MYNLLDHVYLNLWIILVKPSFEISLLFFFRNDLSKLCVDWKVENTLIHLYKHYLTETVSFLHVICEIFSKNTKI